MSSMGGSVGVSESHGRSGVQYYPGQENALGGIFGPGGVFSQFLAGKPNAGYERQQTQGLEQLRRAQAQNGLAGTPLGTRQQSDFLQQSNAAAGDDWLKSLFAFMNPAGSMSQSSSHSTNVSGSV